MSPEPVSPIETRCPETLGSLQRIASESRRDVGISERRDRVDGACITTERVLG